MPRSLDNQAKTKTLSQRLIIKHLEMDEYSTQNFIARYTYSTILYPAIDPSSALHPLRGVAYSRRTSTLFNFCRSVEAWVGLGRLLAVVGVEELCCRRP